jgi:D-alanyl-lipoteichoic acid acyltransferase DltB (MBOAT superfamily)
LLFNSLHFLIFFPIVTIAYFALPWRWRWLLLLAASCWFYMAFIPVYILILALTIVVDYFAGLLIEKASGPTRRTFLLISLAANIGVLAVFKYLHFLNENFGYLFSLFHLRYPIPEMHIILPIGLSFHTFQAMSYTIEVYRRHQRAERHFGVYALYVMFYPQLVAGPIERPQNLLHQLREEHRFDYQRVTDGLKLMAWGFFKKVVVADHLSVIVGRVYSHPNQHTGPALTIATVAFAFQIYADFSGYSDIAIGAARVMGVKLMTNFRRPYLAKSIAEFWSRWHISLSTWFRDYLYIPLGGNRVAAWRWQTNLMITFLVSGLWHGANWTYVIWGALNGLYLVAALWTSRLRRTVWTAIGGSAHSPIGGALSCGATFAMTCFAWIFFRAESLHDALYIVGHLTAGLSHYVHISWVVGELGVSRRDLALVLVATLAMNLIDYAAEHCDLIDWVRGRPAWQRWAIYYSVGLATVFLGRFGGQQFIYFQF